MNNSPSFFAIRRPILLLSALFTALLLYSAPAAAAYEVSLHGGGSLNIPEAWNLSEDESSAPAWYSPDYRGAVEAMLWEPGTWTDMQTFANEVRPEGAEGTILSFPCWGGTAAFADWTFPSGDTMFRGWFLLVLDAGPNIRISAISTVEDFPERTPFLLSAIDSYSPSSEWYLHPGAVSRFLEFSSGTSGGEPGEITAEVQGEEIHWREAPASTMTNQDVIEREAVVLSSYAGVPELFYPAWRRYYRMIYRDAYSKMEPLAEALNAGPLPVSSTPPRKAAVFILGWLQSFAYGSIDSLSGLLSPISACNSKTGDCDSLALACLMLLQRYGVEGRLLLSHEAHHAVAALDLPGEGKRHEDQDGSWLTAELTTPLPLGELPPRLDGVSDWFSVKLE